MSTKIYNAYIFTEFITNKFESLFTRLESIREQYREYKKKEILSLYKTFNKEDYINLIKMIDEAVKAGYNCILNIDASAMVYLFDNNIYVQFFGVPVELLNQLDVAYFSDYHYQDQTDKPNDIEDSEWESRALIWEGIMQSSIPAENGFVFPFTSIYTKFDIADFVYKTINKEKTAGRIGCLK